MNLIILFQNKNITQVTFFNHEMHMSMSPRSSSLTLVIFNAESHDSPGVV